MAFEVDIGRTATLAEYDAFAHLTGAVAGLRDAAAPLVPAFSTRTVWMVSSTAQGGGVAEMMPGLVALMRGLGIDTRWVVIESDAPEFFPFTKRLHNLIHGEAQPLPTATERAMYEAVNAHNAAELAGRVRHDDLLVVHDPQPLPLLALLRLQSGVRTLWRCHIGLDEDTPASRAAWDFLHPYTEAADRVVFSAPEYVPAYLTDRAAIVFPGIDPLNPKNRDLSVHRLTRIMLNAGLLHRDLGPLLSPRWEHVAGRLRPDGGFAAADDDGDIGLLTRPIITQISRWDRLKGFAPLLEAFARFKERAARPDYAAADALCRRRAELVRLVLAGPDPASIPDDPEALAVLEQIRARYLELPERVRQDVAVLTLPMADLEQNALMVNALQRVSSVVVQNSLREGFGLTIAEAMWKQVPVLSNRRACGPRQQVRDGVDGRMAGNPEDPEELCALIDEMLCAPTDREVWGRNAQRRAHDEFLVFTQVRRIVQTLHGLLTGA